MLGEYADNSQMASDMVAVWEIPLKGSIYKVEFEHGTVSGKRVITVNGKEIFRRNWMFKLVGEEAFEIEGVKCVINIAPVGQFIYEYTMTVGGKRLEKFIETQTKVQKCWIVNDTGNIARVVLEKESLDVWVNGDKVEAMREFVENGTETTFNIGFTPACITASGSGNKKDGICYQLFLDGQMIPESTDSTI